MHGVELRETMPKSRVMQSLCLIETIFGNYSQGQMIDMRAQALKGFVNSRKTVL